MIIIKLFFIIMIDLLSVEEILNKQILTEISSNNNNETNIINTNGLFSFQANFFSGLDTDYNNVEKIPDNNEFTTLDLQYRMFYGSKKNLAFQQEIKEIFLPENDINNIFKTNEYLNIIDELKYLPQENNINIRNFTNKSNDKLLSSNIKNNYDVCKNENDNFVQEEPNIVILISNNENCIEDENIIYDKIETTKEEQKSKTILKNKDSNECYVFSKHNNNSYLDKIISIIDIDDSNHDASSYTKKEIEKIMFIGNKRKFEQKKRRDRGDDIRKRIKSRFHKLLKEKLNMLLRKAKSQKLFDYFPQTFVYAVSKDKNKEVMELSIEDLFKKNFIRDYKNYTYHKPFVDYKKYKKNLETLKYLNNNIDIKIKSQFNIIGKLKYKVVLKEYFESQDFYHTIRHLAKKENKRYNKLCKESNELYSIFYKLNINKSDYHLIINKVFNI